MSSKRGYLTIAELEQFADITVTDNTEADDRISQAEELIDAYVGYQEKAVQETLVGLASAGGTTSVTLQTSHKNIYEKDYFKGCYVEIIGGTGVGQRSVCTGSTLAGVLTLQDTLSTALDSTSFYKIYQLGKFPTIENSWYDSENNTDTWYRSIPEEIKRAVAAQVEYLIEMGDSFFSSDKSEKSSESIGDYSYSNATTGTIEKLIAPKAKMLLRGIKNRKGDIIT
jgi:hypothetical protein